MNLQDEIVSAFSTILAQAWLLNCSVLSLKVLWLSPPSSTLTFSQGPASNASKLTKETSYSLHAPNGQSYLLCLIVMTYFLCVLHFE